MKWRSIDQLKKILVSPNDTLLDSLAKMGEAALQVLLVVNKMGQLIGIITDGDIRRALLNGMDLNTRLNNVMNSNPRYLPVTTSINKAKELMQQYSIRHIPLLDDEGRVQDLILWSDCFKPIYKKRQEKIVIMAGGKGSRLDPFTKILPKPMIPIGDKPIIEFIMDKFHQQGFSNFTLSVGYKAEIIKMYFAENNSRPYSVNFIQEDQPLGTAGALGMLHGKINKTFLVTNCDIIVEADYDSLIRFHTEKGNALTILGALKDFTIPYGVLKTESEELQFIDEKPNFHLLVNTGVYVLEPVILDLISQPRFMNMTDLVVLAKENGFKVGVYPYHGKWFDVGQWEDYRNSLRHLGAVE